jgi:threonine 3-dehydrogenase
MIHAAAAGKPYKCFVRESARIPFMTMGDAIQATLALGAADAKRLTRCVYNIGAFSPTAGEFADAVREAFPGAEISFEPDVQRQAIVDSWPEEVDWSAATRDWDYTPVKGFKQAFEEDLLPPIRARYAN